MEEYEQCHGGLFFILTWAMKGTDSISYREPFMHNTIFFLFKILFSKGLFVATVDFLHKH